MKNSIYAFAAAGAVLSLAATVPAGPAPMTRQSTSKVLSNVITTFRKGPNRADLDTTPASDTLFLDDRNSIVRISNGSNRTASRTCDAPYADGFIP